MSGGNAPDDVIRRIFTYKTIAVVGCSPRPERPSHYVAQYLMDRGHTVIPVNPGHKELLGVDCYPNLTAIPFPVEVVDVFRNPEFVEPVIDEAIKIKAKVLWLQDGITHVVGEERARKAGLLVVSDDCMLRRGRILG